METNNLVDKLGKCGCVAIALKDQHNSYKDWVESQYKHFFMRHRGELNKDRDYHEDLIYAEKFDRETFMPFVSSLYEQANAVAEKYHTSPETVASEIRWWIGAYSKGELEHLYVDEDVSMI